MRIVVGVTPNQDPAIVADELRKIGAQFVHEPTAVLPDVVVAEFAQGDTDQLLSEVQQLPGVRYAELDAMRTGFE
jgi:hypothetical protein